MRTNPTLGDLRYALALRGGKPDPGTEIGFDLEPEDEHSNYLPDTYIVARALTAAVVAGAFDDLPDSIPLRDMWVDS